MELTHANDVNGTVEVKERAGVSGRLKRQAALLVAPTVTFLLLMGIFPLFYSLYLVAHRWVLSSGNPPVFVGLGNFVKLLADGRMLISLERTVGFTLGAVTAEFLLGLFIALLLSDQGVPLMRSAVLLPMVIAPTVVGLIWRFMFNSEIGVINFLLSLVGIHGPLWLGNEHIALYALMLVDLWQWTPFIILILLAGLVSLPTDIEEAAVVDGVNWWQMLWNIKLPLLRKAIFVALVFRAIDSLRVFDTVYIVTAGGPNNVTELLSMYIYKTTFRFFDMGYGALLSFVLLVIIILTSRLLMPILEER